MSHRNRMWKEKIICGLLTVLLLFGVGSRVYAAGEDGVSVYLPISQTFDGNQTERVVYQLTALEANAPMPEGSADGSYTFAMTGTANQEIGPMEYVHGGIYRYRVELKTAEEKENYIYDKTVYTVEVYVKNTDDGLRAEIIVLDEAGMKYSCIRFEHAYIAPAAPAPTPADTPRPVKTGDDTAILWYAAALILAFLTLVFIRRVRLNRTANDREK